MKADAILIGAHYRVKQRGHLNWSIYRVLEVVPGNKGRRWWRCLNCKTGREVIAKAAQRFLGHLSNDQVVLYYAKMTFSDTELKRAMEKGWLPS